MKTSTPIKLSETERESLSSWIRSGTKEHRLVERAKMILMAAEGIPTQAIARTMKTRPARVSKWRTRFARQGIEGLRDGTREGAPHR